MKVAQGSAPPTLKKIAIIGRGRVAQALARSFRRAFSVSLLARGAPFSFTADTWVFVAVPEAAWRELRGEIHGGRLVSVSGSMTRQDFADLGFSAVETFHPLMTFVAGEKTSLAGVPVAVSHKALARLARIAGGVPFALPENRTLYHAGAVVAAAGVVSAFMLAADLLALSGLDEKTARKVLSPMATRAVALAAARGADALTGPVARGDEATLAAHRQALNLSARDDAAFYEALIAAMRRLRRSTLHKARSRAPVVK